jgi:hypothetical protein
MVHFFGFMLYDYIKMHGAKHRNYISLFLSTVSIIKIVLKLSVNLQFKLAVNTRNALFWAIIQRVVVIPY